MTYLLVNDVQKREIERINNAQRPIRKLIMPLETVDGKFLLNKDLLNDCNTSDSTWFLWKKVLNELTPFEGNVEWKEVNE